MILIRCAQTYICDLLFVSCVSSLSIESIKKNYAFVFVCFSAVEVVKIKNIYKNEWNFKWNFVVFHMVDIFRPIFVNNESLCLLISKCHTATSTTIITNINTDP